MSKHKQENKEQGSPDSFAQSAIPCINDEDREEPSREEAKKEAKWSRGKNFNP